MNKIAILLVGILALSLFSGCVGEKEENDDEIEDWNIHEQEGIEFHEDNDATEEIIESEGYINLLKYIRDTNDTIIVELWWYDDQVGAIKWKEITLPITEEEYEKYIKGKTEKKHVTEVNAMLDTNNRVTVIITTTEMYNLRKDEEEKFKYIVGAINDLKTRIITKDIEETYIIHTENKLIFYIRYNEYVSPPKFLLEEGEVYLYLDFLPPTYLDKRKIERRLKSFSDCFYYKKTLSADNYYRKSVELRLEFSYKYLTLNSIENIIESIQEWNDN